MTTQQEWRDSFVHRMARANVPLHAVRDLMKHSCTLQRLAVYDCNVGLTPKQQRKWERTVQRVQQIASEHGLATEVQGDPRGAVLRVLVDSGHGRLELPVPSRGA